MKISNEKRKFYFQAVNTIFVVALLIIGFGLFISTGNLKYNLIGLTGLLVVVYVLHLWRGYPMFLYDSDGETLNFTNKDFFMLFGDPRVVKKAEFPKNKLLEFDIRNYGLKKKLKLIVKSKRTASERSKQTFDITYLRNSEIKDLKKSLEKVVHQNQKQNENQ